VPARPTWANLARLPISGSIDTASVLAMTTIRATPRLVRSGDRAGPQPSAITVDGRRRRDRDDALAELTAASCDRVQGYFPGPADADGAPARRPLPWIAGARRLARMDSSPTLIDGRALVVRLVKLVNREWRALAFRRRDRASRALTEIMTPYPRDGMRTGLSTTVHPQPPRIVGEAVVTRPPRSTQPLEDRIVVTVLEPSRLRLGHRRSPTTKPPGEAPEGTVLAVGPGRFENGPSTSAGTSRM